VHSRANHLIDNEKHPVQ